MKILKIIHGFPPDYMAGSEVYSYHLVKELLSQNHDVSVFTRVENQFDDDYVIYDEVYEGINIRRVNKSKRDYLYSDKFYDLKMDEILLSYIKKEKPDVIHIGHLSHLSTNLINIIKDNFNISIIYTIHDFWLFCVKGQLINKEGQRCSGPSVKKCTNCSPYVVNEDEVKKTLEHMQNIINKIDLFISPSHTLRDFFISEGVIPEKIVYQQYGFNKKKIEYKNKVYKKESKLNFGFLGRVIPTKGIKVLFDTFKSLPDANLNIYGSIGAEKRFLDLNNIHFKGSYHNDEINKVLDEIDILIVPSLWLENSPLVIQEAILAGLTVITSNIGGMKELIIDGVNGFTFEVGDTDSLVNLIKRLENNPRILNTLEINRDCIVDIKDEVTELSKIYERFLNEK